MGALRGVLAPGVAYAIRNQLRGSFYREYGSWRDAPHPFVATCVSAVLYGIGGGLAAAFVVLVAASLWVRITG